MGLDFGLLVLEIAQLGPDLATPLLVFQTSMRISQLSTSFAGFFVGPFCSLFAYL